MKRFLPVCAAVLLLAGCSSTPDAVPAEVYYELAGEYFSESTHDELDSYADEICNMMRDGDAESSWLYGVKYLTDAGMDATEAGKFLRFAASYRCTDMLERFPNAG